MEYIGLVYSRVQPVNWYLPQISSDFLLFSPRKGYTDDTEYTKNTRQHNHFLTHFALKFLPMYKVSFSAIIFYLCSKVEWLTWYDSSLFLFQLSQKKCFKLILLVQLTITLFNKQLAVTLFTCFLFQFLNYRTRITNWFLVHTYKNEKLWCF